MKLIDFTEGDLISPDKLAVKLRTTRREIWRNDGHIAGIPVS